MFFSEKYEETLKKSQIGYSLPRYAKLCFAAGIIGALLMTAFFFMIFMQIGAPLYFLGYIFAGSFSLIFLLVRLLPKLSLNSKKAYLESDLLYSARHLLLKLESGSSLLNSIESVSKLNTRSSMSFKELMFDISMGMPLENAINKAIEYSPSAAFVKMMEEIMSSLKTGADIQKTLRSTLDDLTREHLIMIEEYGKKLNPMSMFYMIIGTILPSLGTAMLVVGASLLPGSLIIDKRILLAIAFMVLVIQIFFVLGFRSLKPAVMQ